MKFDIVSLDAFYRGLDRSLNADDLLRNNAKSHYKELIGYYFRYLDIMYSPEKILYNMDTFNLILDYYKTFKSLGVDCEIIVYDDKPLKNAFNYSIEFLGIDVVHDLAESLLEDFNDLKTVVKKHLNSHGLLENLDDMDIVLNNCFTGGMKWEPCWVYKVILGESGLQ